MAEVSTSAWSQSCLRPTGTSIVERSLTKLARPVRVVTSPAHRDELAEELDALRQGGWSDRFTGPGVPSGQAVVGFACLLAYLPLLWGRSAEGWSRAGPPRWPGPG